MTSTQSEQTSMQIIPPIVVDEHGDVEAYPSVSAATAAVEVVDVLNKEYAFYDSTGRVLEPHVHKGKVDLVPSDRLDSDSPVLRRRIAKVLSLLGVSDEISTRASFSELSRLLLERSKRKGG